MKQMLAILVLSGVIVGCAGGPATGHQDETTVATPRPSDTRTDSKPTPYEDVEVVGKLTRREYAEVAETVLNHRPFKLPDDSYDWYTPAIMQVVVTDDRSKAVAITRFDQGGGNVVTLERKTGKWEVVSVTKWTR